MIFILAFCDDLSEMQKMKFFQESEKVNIMEDLQKKSRILINIL